MGLIPEDIIRELRDRADLVAVIGRHVELRKAGRNHKGLCPFHQEKTPSFNVNGDKGFFYCFGCQKKGDVFTFLMEYDGKSFFEAAEELSQLTGIDLPERVDPSEARAQRSLHARMLEVNELAAGFFRRALLDERAGAPARRYLAERGIGDEVAEAFRLGYAPGSWTALGAHLEKRGAPAGLAQKLGLVAPRPRAGGTYDRFRDRLMCPVAVPGGSITGFSGRLLADADAAKYINSPESPVYKKSKLLFGLHQARAGIRRAGRAVLVEGNFDVISLHQAGFDETVAPLGTALTPEQADKLRRLVDRVVLLYDGDNAGRAATLKGLQVLVGAGLEVAIAELPLGYDPDTVLRDKGAGALSEVLDRPQPAVEYFIDNVWRRAAHTADGRARALAEAAPVVKSVQDGTKRDLIVGTLAAAMGVEPRLVQRALRDRGPEPPAAPAREPQAPRPPANTAPPPREELAIVQILADHAGLLETAESLGVFSLLTDSRLRDMYSAARGGHALLSALPEDDGGAVAKRVLAGDYANLADPERTLRDAVANIRRHRRREELRRRKHEESRQQARHVGDADRQRELFREILKARQVD